MGDFELKRLGETLTTTNLVSNINELEEKGVLIAKDASSMRDTVINKFRQKATIEK